jgi:hypothetical protein
VFTSPAARQSSSVVDPSKLPFSSADAAIAARSRRAGPRAELQPDGRVERVAELVASAPRLDADRFVAIDSTQHDSVRPTATASPATERNETAAIVAPRDFEFLPDRLVD